MKKFLLIVILIAILFTFFVYFGGGNAVKYAGQKFVAAGEYLNTLQTQMNKYIENKIHRLQKAKKGLLSSSP